MADEDWRPKAGEIIDGTYRVGRVLGEGGMGIVVAAHDLDLDRKVAIKFVKVGTPAGERLAQQLVEEARAMARIKHPNLLDIFRFGRLSGVPFFVMEFVKGQDLVDWRNAIRRPLTPDEALDIMQPLCSAVSAMHRAGFVHGDIKPGNVMVPADGRIRLMDLGLTRRFGVARTGNEMWGGTPDYMAPELWQEQPPDEFAPQADVYALGVLAFQLLTDNDPFPSIDDSGPAPAPHERERQTKVASDVRPALGTRFDAPLLRALATDPAARTRTPARLWKELQVAHRSMGGSSIAPAIVVIDDDEDMLELIEAGLRDRFGPRAEIRCHTDPVLGLHDVVGWPPRLLIVDFHMPGMSGLDVVRRVRTEPGSMDVPILALTGSASADTWRQFKDLGADAFLAKPVVPELLMSTAEWLIDRASADA